MSLLNQLTVLELSETDRKLARPVSIYLSESIYHTDTSEAT